MTPERELATLKKKRSVFKGQMTNFKQFLEGLSQHPDCTLLSTKLSRIEHHFSQVLQVQSDIECLDMDTDYTDERAALENDFDEWSSKAKNILKTEAIANASTTGAVSGDHVSTHIVDRDVRLPQIGLPTFSGAFDDWPVFSLQFTSSVHNNSSINESKKLTYLRSCLTGDAARTIESLDNEASNYAVAWSLLERKFNQPALVARGHIGALLSPAEVCQNQRDLHKLLANAESHYEALKAKNQLTVDNLLVCSLVSRLDDETIEKWREAEKADFPTFDRLLEFLRERCRIITPNTVENPDRQQRSKKNATSRNQPNNRRATTHTTNVLTTQVTSQCALCKQDHFTYKCNTFTTLTPRERLTLIKQHKLCVNCLRSGHSAYDCTSSKCKKCAKKHHTMLHLSTDATHTQDHTTPASSHTDALQPSATCVTTTIPSEVLLFTAVIDVHDVNGRAVPCRVLLDSCSQIHLFTEHMAEKLNLPRQSINVPISGVNKMESKVKHYVTAKIKSRQNNYSEHLTFLIVPSISQRLPTRHYNTSHIQLPKNIRLADPNYNKPADIDGLLGAELFCKLLCSGQITLKNSAAYLQKTLLGWVVSGALTQPHASSTVNCHVTTMTNLENQIKRFWEVEEGAPHERLSPEEAACERHYSDNVARDSVSGRYTVALPFATSAPHFEQSHAIALKRFYSLERSLSRNPDLKSQYTAFLREYEELGHMTQVQSTDVTGAYFIPHLPVQKATSLTTKLRVVFDASARAANGLSLNDTLLTGPTIQDDIFTIITRFRSHTYVLTADVTKMYRQILVRPEDRRYQRIIWRENETDSIKIYELNTVTYGTTSAPFLATRTLLQLASDESASHPEAAVTLRNDFYVDDMLTGGNTLERTRQLRDELITLTEKGGFQLRQWASNEPALIGDLTERSSDSHLCLDADKVTKTLGIFWNAKTDTIEYRVRDRLTSNRITKRSILSEIAQLYDPLGLLGPVVIRAKMIMQQVWQLQLDWDESLPASLWTTWGEHSGQMPLLEQVRFPRKIIADACDSLQLHGFSDASERAYGACIYIRSTDTNGNATTRLVCSKTRVAPLKSLTLPRLELCAAVLLTKLIDTTSRALKLTFDHTCLWSDSTIVLQWINTPPHTLKTFVSNRVADIQSRTLPSQWRHVSSGDNPADIISRGLTPREFLERQTFWQEGPSWLRQAQKHWPETILLTREVPETRGPVSLALTIHTHELLHRFSSLPKLKRILAYWLRFAKNARANTDRIAGPLTSAELQAAWRRILLLTQRDGFPREVHILKHNLTSDSKLKHKLSDLAPFFDEDGIIRVGGRLRHADLPYNQKHPILLPTSHHITRLIIRESHIKNYHAGAQATLNNVRQNYWPVHGASAVKAVTGRCVTCRRAKPVTVNYEMGDLPVDRLSFKRPFSVSGVDYCGPFYVRERRHRNTNKLKVYVAIFICFATKAVHLELVENLTSEAFLAALSRFFSRRGKCTDLYSDNATTFVGAHREVTELYNVLHSRERNATIADYLKDDHINWHYIPPRSPHHGGLWEAAVRSFKHHLYRVVGETLLSYEALLTCVIEIEAVLNSRPLTPLSNDPNDLHALTPGHFLIGDAINSLPQHDLTSHNPGRLSIWQHAQQLRQHFWQRWYKEYLHHLTVRKKWHAEKPTAIELGMLVTVREDNMPPMRWPLGRIVQLHPGKDGTVRVVTVKTSSGEYKRNVKKLSPLPADLTCENNKV